MMGLKCIFVLFLLCNGVCGYEIINNTCFKIVNDTEMPVSMEYCIDEFKEGQPEIILYEKLDTGRCYSSDECKAGLICDNKGQCVEPSEPQQITAIGIVIVFLSLVLVWKVLK